MLHPSRRLAALTLLGACLAQGLAAQTYPLPSRWVDVVVDSGPLDNPTDLPAVVFSTLVDAGEDSRWLQLRFTEAVLPGGSLVRITSLLDGDVQPLSGPQLVDEWRYRTAYFNGSRVLVDLVAGPGTSGNRLVLAGATASDPEAALAPDPQESICAATDDRLPSFDPAVGRLIVSGNVCTGFILADVVAGGEHFHLTAGQCLFGSSTGVMQFEVPLSVDQCFMVAPPASKQFAIRPDFLFSLGTGDDWAVYRCFDNPVTGKTTFEEQAAAYTRAAITPTSATVDVTGHGSDANEGVVSGGNANCGCDPKTFSGTWNLIQQTASGPITDVTGNLVSYLADTCSGSSGSPVVDQASGEVVAVHGNGFCHLGLANVGTATNHPEIDAAIALFGSGPVWSDLESGLGGIFGVPNLWGDGTLLGGDPVMLTLVGALQNTSVGLVIGFTGLYAPFKGGTLVPNPDILVLGLQTDANGSLVISSTWPNGVPSGFETYYQAWITDFTGPAGFAASQATLGTTP